MDAPVVDDPPILALPLETLEKIVLDLDTKSLINLAKCSKKARKNVFDALGRGNSAREYWSLGCKHFYEDTKVLDVLGSYVSKLDNDNAEANITDKCNHFMWDKVCLLAHDLPYQIQESVPSTLKRMAKFEKQIKIDFFLSECLDFDVEDKDTENLSVYPHIIGCSGPFSWRTMFLRGPDLLMFYENMETCRKIISIPNESPKVVHRIEIINFPRSPDAPTQREVGVRRVFQVAVILCDSCVYFAPLNDDTPLKAGFTPYKFKPDTYMKPMMAIHKNYVAIWSSPYDLKIHELSISRSGGESSSLILQHQVIVELNDRNTEYMGCLWQKMANSGDDQYFFSFKFSKIGDVSFASRRHGDSVRACEFEIMICSPRDDRYLVTVSNVIEYLTDGKQFSFRRNTTKRKMNTIHERQSSSEIKFDEIIWNSTMGYGLMILYSEKLLCCSNDGVQWYVGKLHQFLFKNKEKGESRILSVKVIAENVISIIVQDFIIIVESTCIPLGAFCGEISSIDEFYSAEENNQLHASPIRLNILQNIPLNFPNPSTTQISQVAFSYDRGVPYLLIGAYHNKNVVENTENNDDYPTSSLTNENATDLKLPDPMMMNSDAFKSKQDEIKRSVMDLKLYRIDFCQKGV